MRVLIEKYRGWEIKFDTEKEVFYCYSDNYDTESHKKSYAASKKYVDDFLKENQTFRPIVVEGKPNSCFGKGKIKIVGIRKDGRFVYEEDGKVRQLPGYSNKDYMIYNSENEVYKVKIAELEEKIKLLKKEQSALKSEMKVECLEEYRKELLKNNQ